MAQCIELTVLKSGHSRSRHTFLLYFPVHLIFFLVGLALYAFSYWMCTLYFGENWDYDTHMLSVRFVIAVEIAACISVILRCVVWQPLHAAKLRKISEKRAKMIGNAMGCTLFAVLVYVLHCEKCPPPQKNGCSVACAVCT